MIVESCLNPFRNTNLNELGKRCVSGLNCCPLTASPVLLELINSAMARMFRIILICTVDKIDYNAIGKRSLEGVAQLFCRRTSILHRYSSDRYYIMFFLPSDSYS